MEKEQVVITPKEISIFFGKNVTRCKEVCKQLENEGYLIPKYNGYKLNEDKIVDDIKRVNPEIVEEDIRNLLRDSRLIAQMLSKIKTAKSKDYEKFLESFGIRLAVKSYFRLNSMEKDIGFIKEKLQDMDLIKEKLGIIESKLSKK